MYKYYTINEVFYLFSILPLVVGLGPAGEPAERHLEAVVVVKLPHAVALSPVAVDKTLQDHDRGSLSRSLSDLFTARSLIQYT